MNLKMMGKIYSKYILTVTTNKCYIAISMERQKLSDDVIKLHLDA